MAGRERAASNTTTTSQDAPLSPGRQRRARPQSVIAEEWSSKLDNLFQIDSGLDTRLQSVEEKRKSVYTQNRQLEELEARIRAAEERLKQSGISGPEPAAGPSTLQSHSPERASDTAKSIFTTMETNRIPEEEEEPSALEEAKTPASTTDNEFVVVDRPRVKGRPQEVEKEDDDEEEDDEDDEDEDEEDEDDSDEEEDEDEDEDEDD